MSNPKHYPGDLAQMQSLPLGAKIRMTQNRVRQWYDHFNGEVYVSFSGGTGEICNRGLFCEPL